MISLPGEISAALEALENAGYASYLVGGFLRDFYLGRRSKDFDLATKANPEQVKEVFSGHKIFETGIRFGTLTLLLGDYSAEITTLRSEGAYTDGRRPDKVDFIGDIYTDLARRDFTMNAMAYRYVKRDLIDPYDGQGDIKQKLIRAVGNSLERFKEDSLRILRALRFASVLGFEIEDETRRAVFSALDFLSPGSNRRPAAERLREEFSLLLCGKNAGKLLADFREVFSVLFAVALSKPLDGAFPELSPCFELVFGGDSGPSPETRSSPDSGPSPETRSSPDSGPSPETRSSPDSLPSSVIPADPAKPSANACSLTVKLACLFGASDALSIAEELKFDSRTLAKLRAFKEHEKKTEFLDRKNLLHLLQDLGPQTLSELLFLENSTEKQKILKEFLESGLPYRTADLALDGKDLLKLGYQEGPELGRALQEALEAVWDKKAANTAQSLIQYLRASG